MVPMLSPCLSPSDQHPGISKALATGIDAFPLESTCIYVQSSERMHRQAFLPLGGSLCWISGQYNTCIMSVFKCV